LNDCSGSSQAGFDSDRKIGPTTHNYPDGDVAVYTAPVITTDEALSFVKQEGVVLVSARGSLPCLVEVILGEPIKGSWWAHPRSRGIFAVLQEVEESTDLLRCRLL